MHVDDIGFGQNAEAPRHFLVGLGGFAHAETCAVTVETLVGRQVPETAGIGANFVGQHDA